MYKFTASLVQKKKKTQEVIMAMEFLRIKQADSEVLMETITQE